MEPNNDGLLPDINPLVGILAPPLDSSPSSALLFIFVADSFDEVGAPEVENLNAPVVVEAGAVDPPKENGFDSEVLTDSGAATDVEGAANENGLVSAGLASESEPEAAGLPKENEGLGAAAAGVGADAPFEEGAADFSPNLKKEEEEAPVLNENAGFVVLEDSEFNPSGSGTDSTKVGYFLSGSLSEEPFNVKEGTSSFAPVASTGLAPPNEKDGTVGFAESFEDDPNNDFGFESDEVAMVAFPNENDGTEAGTGAGVLSEPFVVAPNKGFEVDFSEEAE